MMIDFILAVLYARVEGFMCIVIAVAAARKSCYASACILYVISSDVR